MKITFFSHSVNCHSSNLREKSFKVFEAVVNYLCLSTLISAPFVFFNYVKVIRSMRILASMRPFHDCRQWEGDSNRSRSIRSYSNVLHYRTPPTRREEKPILKSAGGFS